MRIEFNNIYTHYVITTLHRQQVIPEKSRVRIEKYITGVVKNNYSKLYAIYINPEHAHLLVSRYPKISDEELITTVAECSKKFINENKLIQGGFDWQETCAAFSVSKGDVDKVCKYILNQSEHHKKVTFQEEYEKFMKFYQKTLKWDK